MDTNTLYFAFNDIEADFSIYGNDVVWSGVVVDEENHIVNPELAVKTCEMGTDFGEMIAEMDEEGEIFDEYPTLLLETIARDLEE